MLRANVLENVDRFLPDSGVNVYPYITYRDVNDIESQERHETKHFFRNDPVYHELSVRGQNIQKGSVSGHKLASYVYRNGESLGVLMFLEILDNPHGYGVEDFFFVKWIYPQYRNTKYSRYAFADLMHILFFSGIAKRLYVYAPSKIGDGSFFDRVDSTLPCTGKYYSGDGPTLQPYISVKEEIQTEAGPYILVEFNGTVYMGMDLEKYFLSGPGRSVAIVRQWLLEMNGVAQMVGELWKP